MSRILIILFFLISAQAEARLMAKLSMIYKNGIDKNLVLESELHSIEDLWGKGKIKMRMKNGAQFDLTAGFWERPVAKLEEVGPSSKIFIEGKLFMPNGKLVKQTAREGTQVDLGQAYVLEFQDKTQLLRVSITPYLEK